MTKNNNHVDVDYSQKILEVKNLKKYFYVGVGKNKLKVPAVDNVSFDIHKREVFGLVGESGCGKTTTGRTIIKLYTPTDGSVDLNGIRIGAGYDSIVENIKKIKREAKEKILRLNPTSFKKYQINQEAEKSINFIKQDIDELKQKQIATTKELMSPIEKYVDDLYQLENLYTLDIARFNYDFALKKGEIENLKHNKAEKEYKNELLIAENTYKHKLDGLKDSAALTKETIEERIKNLKSIYQETLSDLEKTYSTLIEQAEKDRLPNSEVKIRIQALKKERDDLISKRHNQFENDKQKFQKPDEAKIKEKVIESKKEFKLQIDKKQQEIKDIKAKAKMSILEISKQKDEKHLAKSNKDEIDAIKKERHEQIKLEKEQIRNVKDVNKSKEALAASRKMQMIFQDPISSLNPRMTVKEIVSEGLVILGGYSDEEISKRVSDVLELVGLSAEYATRYPHEFSGGQRQRIGIARALIMNPNFIIADEPISALDVSIRAQVINLLRELREELGLTILFIAHDLSVVRFFCDRIAVMYYGKLVELAPSEELFANPMHPYTKSLLSAIPQPDPDYEKGRQRINYDPSQHDYRLDKPSLREVAPGHMVFANDKEYQIIKKEYEISAHKKATDLED